MIASETDNQSRLDPYCSSSTGRKRLRPSLFDGRRPSGNSDSKHSAGRKFSKKLIDVHSGFRYEDSQGYPQARHATVLEERSGQRARLFVCGINQKKVMNYFKRFAVVLGAILPLSATVGNAAWRGADGTYSGPGGNVIEVRSGIPTSTFANSFIATLDVLIQQFETTAPDIVFSYSVSSIVNGTRIVLTGTSQSVSASVAVTVTSRVLSITATKARVITTFSISEATLPFNFSNSFVENFTFNRSNLTISLSGRVYRQRMVGSGRGQGNAFIPINPNWTRTTTLNPLVRVPTRVVWCDPPTASGWNYRISSGRKERFYSAKLPSGFGRNLKVYASASNQSPVFIGTFRSGQQANLSPFVGEKGASYLRIDLGRRVAINKKRPFPVGLSFVSLNKPSAKFSISPRNVRR